MHFRRYQKAVIWAIVLAFLIGGVGLIGLERSGVFQKSSGTKPTTNLAASVNGTRISEQALAEAAANYRNQVIQTYQQMGQDTSSLLAGASGALFQLQVESRALQELVRQVLYTQEASRRKVRVPEDKVNAEFDAQYNALLENYQLTEADLASLLAGQGQTLSGWKAKVRASVAGQLRDQALRAAVVTPLQPTDEELQAYFEKNISTYDKPEEIRASHILVADQAEAQAILERLKNGEDFAALAKESSTDTGSTQNGGDLGWFSRGKMVKEFEDAAFALQVGETSGIVQSQYGFHIIRATDRRAPSTPTLAEAKDQVKSDYTTEKQDQEFSAWYAKLYGLAKVEINLPLVKASIDQQADQDLGLAEFERAKAEGSSQDPYLPYYIGRIYEAKMLTAGQEKSSLQSKQDKTAEDTARIDELTKQTDDLKAKAVAAYLEALDKVEPDEDFLNRVIALAPDSATALYLYGKLLYDRGDAFGADLKFRDAIRKDPSYVAAYVGAGDVAAEQRAYKEAVDQYNQALKIRPNDTSVMVKLASAQLGAGQMGEADSLLAQIERLDPQNPKLATLQGDLAFTRLTAAIAERQKLQEKADRSTADDARLKELAVQISSFGASAADRYQQALTTSGSVEQFEKLGRVHLALGELDKAETAFRDAIARSPYRADAYEGLGDVLLKRGDTQGAIEDYRTAFTRALDDARKQGLGEKIIGLVPTDLDMRARLAKVYAKQYMWSSAIKQYAAILEAKPDTLDAYRGIAEAYSWRTEYGTALDYLRRAFTYASTDSAKIDLYSQMVAINQSQVGQGKPLSAPGLDASFELAKLYLAQGKTAQAKEKLEKIAKDAPTYRKDEVAALLVQAGGGTPATPTTGSPQTPSNGR